MSILNKNYVVIMDDGSKWAVPVRFIAEHRAKYYAERDGVSFEESLNKDTLPLFESDDYEIHDWGANNLNFEDVKSIAKLVSLPKVDYEDGWCNGDYEIQENSDNQDDCTKESSSPDTSDQINLAVQQLIGFASAKAGCNVVDVVISMGLENEEWEVIKKTESNILSAEDKEAVDEYFKKDE